MLSPLTEAERRNIEKRMLSVLGVPARDMLESLAAPLTKNYIYTIEVNTRYSRTDKYQLKMAFWLLQIGLY